MIDATMAKDILRMYERWEADLITEDENWDHKLNMPIITETMMDRLIEIQKCRNEVLYGHGDSSLF